MFGQFSGSQGNTVASHNKFGSYLRNRVIPADPATVKQLAIRALLQSISEIWRALSDAQRLPWTFLGDQMVRLDAQGQSYTLTPLQAFTSINMNRNLLGLGIENDAPAFNVPAQVYTFVLAADGAEPESMTVTSDVSLGAADKLVVEASAGISAGINFVPRSSYKFLEFFDSAAMSPFDILATWSAIYGVPLTTTKIFARGRVINTDGFAGGIFSDTVIVA